MSLYHPIVFLTKAEFFLIFDQVRDHFLTDIVAYQRFISKLIYLAYRIKPDIAFVMR